MRHSARHARRLARDASALGLAQGDEDSLRSALSAIGRGAFGAAAGVVRLALLRDPAAPGRTLTVGTTRDLGPEPRAWRAVRHAEPHPGPFVAPGVKHEGVAAIDAARRSCLRAGVDEALLADRRGALVEGSRTSVFVALGADVLVTPRLETGAVAGVAREIVLEHIPQAREDEIPFDAIFEAREIVLVNAVRGAVTLTHVDGRPVGSCGGDWTARLHALLLSDPPP